MSESIIKISTQTIRELTAIAKQQNLCRYYKHKNTDDIALLSEQSIHDMLQYHHQELTSIKKVRTSRKDHSASKRNGQI